MTSATGTAPAGDTPAPSAAGGGATEYDALRSGCGLLDRSDRGKLALTGPDAAEFLNGQVTNDVAALAAGQGCYAAFLTHKGKMLGDLRVLALGEPGAEVTELALDTERVALQALFDLIRRFKLGYDVELHKRTLQSALLSLIGPRARAVAAAAVDAGPGDHRAPVITAPDGPTTDALAAGADEHSHRAARIAHAAVRLVATAAGGVDVLLAAADRNRVTDALLAAGARPVGVGAAEIVRVERGEPRYGLDMGHDTIPQEAGLNERAVSFTKGCYVGQETVARLHYKGKPNRYLRGLRLSAPAHAGADLWLGERAAGVLGSAVLSPRLGPIGLAIVRREAGPGDHLGVGADRARADVVALPFA